MTQPKKTKRKATILDQRALQRELNKFLAARQDKTYTAKQVLQKMKIANNKDSVVHALEALVQDGVVVLHAKGKYRYAGQAGGATQPITAEKKGSGSTRSGQRGRPPREVTVIGTADLTRSGAAFISVEGMDRDVFVAPGHVNTAMQGDTVEVRLAPARRGRPEGEVVRIIRRLQDHFIGTLRITRRGGIVVPDKQQMPFDILIEEKDLNEAANGEKVLVKVTQWPGPGSKIKNLRGIVTGRFEGQSSNDVEMQAILVHNNFPLYFTADALTETRNLPMEISEEEVQRRRDFRGVTTFTIDPADARDFDDALSYRKLEDGGCEIGIHIADVTHYVRPGTALDREAYERSTSVYLVDRVLPMLPERISNEICSLRPHEDSLTFSAVFTFDASDRLRRRWFGKTVIHSDHRFAYEEAQAVLDSGEGPFVEELRHLNLIAGKLRKTRFRNGAIAFESEEVKFRLNEEGVPIEVYVKERQDTHLLIEDFMLLANKEVAEFIRKKEQGQPVPFVYRIHDLPDPDKLADFVRFAREMGFVLEAKTPRQVASSFNKLAKAARKQTHLRILEPIAIRTMAKAVYSTENIGHYGLAFDHYTHFTSPIRRYSDVLVHRILEKNLHAVQREDKEALESQCRYISKQERHANTAERESIKYKQVEYIEKHVGEIFEGQISGMMDRGIFIQLTDNMVEGMAPFSHFPEPYDVDDGRLKAIGRYSGDVLKMGDKVQVQILFADLARRQVEMRVILE
jgi:ribonuclease R